MHRPSDVLRRLRVAGFTARTLADGYASAGLDADWKLSPANGDRAGRARDLAGGIVRFGIGAARVDPGASRA